jgi:nitronate monooxygenase
VIDGSIVDPIVLAPLAGGPSTPELTAAVSNADGLGFLAAGYLTPAAFADQLVRTRELTDRPFGVNLFVLEPSAVDDEAIAAYAQELEADARARGVQLGTPRFDDDWFDAKLQLVLEARVPIVSTTFAAPPAAARARLQEQGVEVWATVTSVAEARAAAEARADALVVQGVEAGGHRASWSDEGEDSRLLPLLAAVVESGIGLPLIATGGIADAKGVAAALAAGAKAAQIGTAFLLCPEAGTSEAHRRALPAGGETAITRAFTGRRARGIVNQFMRAHPQAPSAYPHIHHLTAPLRSAARAAGDPDGINLWAGVNFPQAEAAPAAAVVERLRP